MRFFFPKQDADTYSTLAPKECLLSIRLVYLDINKANNLCQRVSITIGTSPLVNNLCP